MADPKACVKINFVVCGTGFRAAMKKVGGKMKYDFRKCFVALIFLLTPLAVYSQNINIPDPSFKVFLVSNYDTNGDGEIQVSEAEAVTGEMDCSNEYIADLTGIEHFVNITGLDCSDNRLSTLNVNSNSELINLDCSYNKLIALNVSGFVNLQRLSCCYNQLTSLNVTNCISLWYLDCHSNQLNDIPDIAGCTNLDSYECHANNFNADDCSVIASIEALGLSTFSYNPQRNGDIVDCSQPVYVITATAHTGGSISSSGDVPLLENTTWTFSFMPDPGMVVQDVVIDGVSLGPQVFYTFKHILRSHTLDVYFEDDSSISILDPSFKTYLTGKYDTNEDGEIQVSEAQAVRGSMYIPGYGNGGGNISDLTGIGYFTGVTDITCSGQQLVSLDVSGNCNLKSLDCDSNCLTNLNLDNCTNLQTLDCGNNELETLDVSDCANLKTLSCDNNELNHLNVTPCKKLAVLDCSYNQFTSLNLNNCTDLQTLSCYSNELNQLNTRGCTKLAYLDCNSNFLASMDLSTNVNLMILDCSTNQLASLHVDSCTRLRELYCIFNRLTTLNLGFCPSLEKLECYANQLKDLDVTGCEDLWKLNCGGNGLQNLDVSTCLDLRELDCSVNGLTTLNVSGNVYLNSLNCNFNKLNRLNVSGCVGLKYLDVSSNQLATLTLSTCSSLEHLLCYDNELTDIPDLSTCAFLTTLQCQGNYLNADDCPTISSIEAMGLSFFSYNNQADGFVLDCSSSNTHVIACTAGAGGEVTPTGSQEVFDGSSQIIHVFPSSGYYVADVIVDGESVGGVYNYVFSNITADHTITAIFAPYRSPVIDSFTAEMTSVNAPEIVHFSCTAHDPDGGDIVQYLWQITGQQPDTIVTTTNTLAYRFILPGEYSVSVTVTDDEGQTATAALEDNGSVSAISVSAGLPISIPIPTAVQINTTKGDVTTVETTAVNESDGAATVTLDAKDSSGGVLATDTITVPPKGSAVLSSNSFNDLDYGFLEATADRHLLLFSRVSTDTAMMTANLSDNFSSALLVPHIAEEVTYWNTCAYLSNWNPMNLKIMVAGQAQTQAAVPSETIDLENLLPTDLTVADAWGSLSVSSTNPFSSNYTLSGFEMFVKDGSDGAATELVGQSSTILYIPHIPEETDIFWTGFALLNPGDNPATVMAAFYDDDGTVVGTETLSIPANSKIKGLMSGLFPDEAGTAKWGIFQSDQAINGIEIYGTYHAGICGLTLPTAANAWGILPDVLTGDGKWTGIAITNVTGTDTLVTIQLVGADGTVKEEKTEPITAMHRFKAVVADYFTTATVEPGDTVRYFSDKPIIAVEASGDLDRSFMTALTGSR